MCTGCLLMGMHSLSCGRQPVAVVAHSSPFGGPARIRSRTSPSLLPEEVEEGPPIRGATKASGSPLAVHMGKPTRARHHTGTKAFATAPNVTVTLER